MKHPVIHALSVLTLTTLLVSPIQAAPPSVPSAIDQFVEKVFPEAIHYHWVVNDTQTETKYDKKEMILDIRTFVRQKGNETTQIENRFLLFVLNGEVMGAQKIPLGAHVDCQKDEEV